MPKVTIHSSEPTFIKLTDNIHIVIDIYSGSNLQSHSTYINKSFELNN